MMQQGMNPPFLEGMSEAQTHQRAANKRRRNAWLAAIIIITPLLWIMPTFLILQAQSKSRNILCESSLKTFGSQLLGHAERNNGYLPKSKDWVNIVRGTEGLQCPADTDRKHPVSYAMNANLSGKKLSEIKNPHDVVLLYETTSKAVTPFGTGADLVRIGKEGVSQGRHNKIAARFNFFLMADGTIRRAGSPEEMKSLRWK